MRLLAYQQTATEITSRASRPPRLIKKLCSVYFEILRPGRRRAHERADVPAPFGVEAWIAAGREPHHLAVKFTAGEKIPGARFDLDRGDLIFPAVAGQIRLILLG